MGRFLHIGLIYQFEISKKKLEKNEISLEELESRTKEEMLLDFSIYDKEEKEESYLWTLKKDVLENDLFSLLEKFYPLYYRKSKDYYETILSEIKDKNGEDVINFANKRQEEAYQLSNYFESKLIYFEEKGFRTFIDLSFRPLILTMEGKISMETYGSAFYLFTYSLQTVFKDNPLSKTFVVYIGG